VTVLCSKQTWDSWWDSWASSHLRVHSVEADLLSSLKPASMAGIPGMVRTQQAGPPLCPRHLLKGMLYALASWPPPPRTEPARD
jgi:hypothetical protein